MVKSGNRLKLATEILSVAVGIFGIWILVYLSFIPGLFFVILGVLIFITSRRALAGEESESTRSFWAFDREEKGNWEDIDRVIRR
jgi:hypothetical protein